MAVAQEPVVISLILGAYLHLEDLLVDLMICMSPCLMRNLSLLNSSIDGIQADTGEGFILRLPTGPLPHMELVAMVEVTLPTSALWP